MNKIIFFLGVFLPVAASALTTQESSIDCQAFRMNQWGESGRRESAPLKVTSFDPEYLRAEIGQYSFGADLFYLPEGVGLIIHNDETGAYARITAGFRKISGSQQEEATLTFVDPQEEGTTLLQLSCYRGSPDGF